MKLKAYHGVSVCIATAIFFLSKKSYPIYNIKYITKLKC